MDLGDSGVGACRRPTPTAGVFGTLISIVIPCTCAPHARHHYHCPHAATESVGGAFVMSLQKRWYWAYPNYRGRGKVYMNKES
eukprot:640629-Rhodomonas_salina.1